jgi:hypothetical protein
MSAEFGRISYALFRTDREMGRVIAFRCPDKDTLQVGGCLQEALHISDESMAHLNRHERDVPLFVMTDVGLGILSGRYTLHGGMGLFLHIHCHPEAGARLVNSGMLGAENGQNYLRSQRVRDLGGQVTEEDAESYPALMEAWQTVHEVFDVFTPDGDGAIPLPRLQEGIDRLAAFAGCELTYSLRKSVLGDTVTAFRQGRVHCYSPRLLESVILYLLTEMRDRSATRGGVCRMEAPEDNGRPIVYGHKPLRLTFHYPVLPKAPRKELSELADAHSYAAQMGNAGGMDLHYSFDPAHSRPENAFPEQIVWLEWVENPALLTTTDLKAGYRLEGEEEARPLFDWEDEIPLL